MWPNVASIKLALKCCMGGRTGAGSIWLHWRLCWLGTCCMLVLEGVGQMNRLECMKGCQQLAMRVHGL
jgi:hypothetical protein